MTGGQATLIGLVIGLIVSAIVAAVSADVLAGPPSRPESVSPDAVWMEEAFGGQYWVACAAGDNGGVMCSAHSAKGQHVLEATYVPRDGKPPTMPVTDIVVREVERVYLNKVAMVPDGVVKFPHASNELTYDRGRRK